MRITSILLALALVAGLAYWFWLRHDPELSLLAAKAPDPAVQAPAQSAAAAPEATSTQRAAREQAAVPVRAMASREADTERNLTLRGRTEANRSVEVRAETSGLVVSQPKRRGAAVAAGDQLCRLDPGGRRAQLAEAEAQLREAEIESEAANRLSARGFAAETSRATQEYELEAARAALELMRLDIDRLDIRAPFSGRLETDAAEIGSLLRAGDLCATLVDLSTVKAVGFVSEREVDLLALGQAATVRLVNGLERVGEVTFVGRVADPDTRTYEVEVTLDNADGRLRDGMTAEITVALPPIRAHLLPQTALTLDDAGRLGVRIVEAGTARFRRVKVLHEDTRGVWVSGLAPAAKVIVLGQEFVSDGRKVLPTPIGWDELG